MEGQVIWWFVYGAIGLGLVAFMFFFVGRIRSNLASGQRLPLSDYVAVVGAALNIVFLVIAVISLRVAVTTYDDAKRSGDEQTKVLQASRDALAGVAQSLDKQENTLEKSRQALDSSVKSAIAQQDLLFQGVANSRQQLRLLKEQWARELEQPDIQAALVYPQSPSIIVRNASKVKPIRTALYQIILFNVDKPQGKRFPIVETTATTVDFIPPEDQYLPAQLALIPAPGDPPPVKGDRLFGYLSISCADCKKHRAYWVFMRYQEEGWYCEGKGPDYPFWQLGPDNIEGYVSEFLRRPDLTKMPKPLE